MLDDPKIKKLSDWQHARLRNEMYFGSRVIQECTFPIFDEETKILTPTKISYVPAILTALNEAVTNSLDELEMIGVGKIFVTYHEQSHRFIVSDTGRGIPINYNEEHQMHTATMAVSETKAGRNFDERGNVAGTNGLGISIVNFCSSKFNLVIHRDKKKFIQNFTEGENDLVIGKPAIIDIKGNLRGTSVDFTLSQKVFSDMTLPSSLVYSLLYMIASTRPKIKIYFNDKLIRIKKTVKQSLFNDLPTIEISVKDEDHKMDFFVTPTKKNREEFSFVNGIPAIHGGQNIVQFKLSFADQLILALKRESKKRKLNPQRSDITDASFFFCVTKMKAPDFDSQSKTRLTNVSVRKLIYDNLLTYDWSKVVRQNREFIEKIYERCASRMGVANNQLLDAEEKKLRKKKIPNLNDATSKNRKECTLAIFEGKSAASTYVSVRNAKTQASMPLRGKIVNLWKSPPKRALQSETTAQMCAACGLIPGKPANPNDLRFKQFQIYTDADPGGSQIGASIISFFYTYWPELFDHEWLKEHNEGIPFVVISLTPLYIISKKKELKYFYPSDEFDIEIWKKQGWKFVMRAKGLAALEIQHWKDHVNDNSSKIPVLDNGNLEGMLDLNFCSSRADDRKELLV